MCAQFQFQNRCTFKEIQINVFPVLPRGKNDRNCTEINSPSMLRYLENFLLPLYFIQFFPQFLPFFRLVFFLVLIFFGLVFFACFQIFSFVFFNNFVFSFQFLVFVCLFVCFLFNILFLPFTLGYLKALTHYIHVNSMQILLLIR